MSEEKKEMDHGPAQMLSDALFMSSELLYVIIVGLNKENEIVLWRSENSIMNAVGMLEAAKLQTLGLTGKDEEREDDEGSS